jgi:hypothetical protein
VREHASELSAQALRYLGATWDGALARVRAAALLGVAGFVAFVAFCGVLVTSVVLLITGLARGLSLALGGRTWLGDLLVGLGLLALSAGGLAVALARVRKGFLRKAERKHEERRQRTRGASVASGTAE